MMRWLAAVTVLGSLAAAGTLAADDPPAVPDYAKLPANTWTLIHREDNAGGKMFARAIYADNVDRLYLWGTGGKKPARNVFLRYELECLDPLRPAWQAALPASRRGTWTDETFPPFRIYGQSGPDGLKYNEGPRLMVVGGYNQTNRVWWWDFDGLRRPSPIHTFNMACGDSKRKRAVYFSDGVTFALDPKTNTWTDLKPTHSPPTCETVAWASMSYDSRRDRVLLFGGGMATNPLGGAPTWLYDCQANTWRRPKLNPEPLAVSPVEPPVATAVEPPLRCNGALVYDPKSDLTVLFGGYDQAAARNDLWVFDGKTERWTRRTPKRAAPPMYAPAAAVLPGGGKILVCGYDARKLKWHHRTSTSADKETWVYDVAADTWTPIHAALRLPGYRWLTAAPAGKHGVVLLVAFGPERRTYALRYDPSAPPAKLPGAPPDTVAWKYPEQKLSLENAPKPVPKAHAKVLADLPASTFVDARPPGLVISKTWSTAVINTDRSEVLYLGGGHSGYGGNDIARYRIADNRWQLDVPPRFAPFLEGTNAGLFGWTYGCMPFTQHTYLWYAYAPPSKTMLYLPRQFLRDGVRVQLTDDPADAFVYETKKHGYASCVYDPAARKMHRPCLGRAFRNKWHLSVIGTPAGSYALVDGTLYHAAIDRTTGRVAWTMVDKSFPKPRQKIKYHYEYQPLLHDTKRDRLVVLKGDRSRVDVFARPRAKEGRWAELTTTGRAAIGREAMYIAKHDAVLWLGEKELWVLDCATNRMAELDVALPKGLYGHECAMVYDPRHDVCVALIPASFSGRLQTFLFRYDPQTARHKPARSR